MIEMNRKEIERLGVIKQVVNKQLTQKAAAEQLGLSVRQVKRLVQRYRAEDTTGLISRRRGQRPTNAIAAAVRQEVMDLVRQHYADFGSTLASEKLAEYHGLALSVETVRRWMITDELWQPTFTSILIPGSAMPWLR